MPTGQVTQVRTNKEDEYAFCFLRVPGMKDKIFNHRSQFTGEGDAAEVISKGVFLSFDIVTGEDGRVAAENAKVASDTDKATCEAALAETVSSADPVRSPPVAAPDSGPSAGWDLVFKSGFIALDDMIKPTELCRAIRHASTQAIAFEICPAMFRRQGGCAQQRPCLNLLRSSKLSKRSGRGCAAAIAAAAEQHKVHSLCGIQERQTTADFSRKILGAADLVLLCFDLKFNRALKSVNLAENDIGDDGAVAISAALENNNTLTELNLQGRYGGIKISAKGAQAIAKMLAVNRALKSANLGRNIIGFEGTAALSKALKSNSTLEELELRENEIGAGGAQSLADMLQFNRALTSVNLLHNELGDGAAAVVAAAKQNGNIKTLCGIAEGKTKFSFYNLSLKLRAPDAVLLSFDLEFNRALKSAYLGGNRIGDEGTATLSKALKSNSTLEELKLWSNEIGAAGAQSLADMLQFNGALTTLDLRNNSIGDQYVLPKINLRPAGVDFEKDLSGIQALAGALKVNRSLNTVDLRYNNIPDEGKQQLRDAVKGKTTRLDF